VIETLDGELVEEGSAYLGERTNNQAEYEALLHALAAIRPDRRTWLDIYSDSELMVRQLEGRYRVKNTDLAERWGSAQEYLDRAAEVTLRHVAREENRRADELANQAIDVHLLAVQGPVGQTAAGSGSASRVSSPEESPGSTGQDARGGTGDGRNARHPSG
jgi:probable phosphoglycerate mutase